MVLYTCVRCQKCFDQKCKYLEHINKQKPCIMQNKKINLNNKYHHYCKRCDKSFSRVDALLRHKNSKLHKQSKQIKNCNTKIIGDHNTINNINNNKIINNNINIILPFNDEEISKLSILDKLHLFMSGENPIVMIIIMTNLNPSYPEYHNVGYTDLKSSYGYIYDGKIWIKKEISAILNDLLNSKEKDLLKIYNYIKEYFSEEQNKNIQNDLSKIKKYYIEPKLDLDFKYKKNLITHLKAKFYNNRHLIIKSIKNGLPICELPYNPLPQQSIFKDGLNIDNIVELIQIKERNSIKEQISKKIALYLLNQISDLIDTNQYKLISIIINKSDLTDINIIINLLSNSIYFGCQINDQIINDKLHYEIDINKYISSLNL